MTLRETLTRLEAEGRLTPREVVAEAERAPDSALHRHIFHVSDADAAERYRLDRARHLIRSFKVTRVEGGPRVRQFVSVAPATAYRATEAVVVEPMTEALLLQALERDIALLQRKYGHLKEFAAIVRGALTDDAA